MHTCTEFQPSRVYRIQEVEAMDPFTLNPPHHVPARTVSNGPALFEHLQEFEGIVLQRVVVHCRDQG